MTEIISCKVCGSLVTRDRIDGRCNTCGELTCSNCKRVCGGCTRIFCMNDVRAKVVMRNQEQVLYTLCGGCAKWW